MNENKEYILSELVYLLEKDGTFQDVALEFLQKLEKFVGVESLFIMQIDAKGLKMATILEAGTREKSIKNDIGVVSAKNYSLCGRKTRIVSDNNATKGQKAELNRLGMKSSISVIIRVNNVPAMYLCAMDGKMDLGKDERLIEVLENAAVLLQSIAKQMITKISLLSSYEVLRNILANIGSGIIVCDKSNGNILFENDVAINVAEVRECIRESLQDVFEDGNVEYAVKHPVEKYSPEAGLWFAIRFAEITWIDGRQSVVATAFDITQKKKNQQRIEFQAHNDFLTGLYNRMKCESDLRKIIKKTVKDGTKGAVLFIDLDDFKHINDGLGHQYGDILLQEVASGLSAIPGLREHCYRMGGDEFVIIVTPDLFDGLKRIINNILSLFNKPWYLMETEYFCTMSMGVSIYPEHSTDVHEITRMADVAMYEAKKGGKNGYAMYNAVDDDSSTVRQLDIENNMRQAIAAEMNEFIVYYQPVVDVNTRRVKSCEALVRWDSKALGFMAPGDFIPLAEYLGLITSIGDYVLEEACKQCKYWNEHGYPDFHVNVNLSVVQLLQKNVVENVGRTMEKTGVNPQNIVLEITESFAINDMRRVLEIIRGLKKLGPRIALDDFGTGYSSLNYIKQLPLDIIKVDKTFIDDIVEDEYAQAFVKLIVDLSKTIGTEIVVEGVEQREQYELLKKIGVDYIQGFYFGRPVPPVDFEDNFKGELGQ